MAEVAQAGQRLVTSRLSFDFRLTRRVVSRKVELFIDQVIPFIALT